MNNKGKKRSAKICVYEPDNSSDNNRKKNKKGKIFEPSDDINDGIGIDGDVDIRYFTEIITRGTFSIKGIKI